MVTIGDLEDYVKLNQNYDNLEEAIKARELANINYNFHPNHGK